MKLFYILLIIPILLYSQDPRRFNHGVSIVAYKNTEDATFYYLTWSSSFNDAWEHNIYSSTIYFDASGNLTTSIPDHLYIGTASDEAQEPVNATINTTNNYILSVWEDGYGTDAPNVKGQLHFPDGTIVKSNWSIAGGMGAQHSAYTAHLGNKYLVFYADEAPPSEGGAVLKAKVIDDATGVETQSISFTPNNEDHWWPVSASNMSNDRTLIIWGSDGYATRGVVLFNNDGTIQATAPIQDYQEDIQQYFYQVEWLEHISKFILIARNGAYDGMTDESQICLIDTNGNITNSVTVTGGILREAKMAVKWNACNNTYAVFYPSGINDLTQISINDSGVIAPLSIQITAHPDLTGFQWVSTGIWSEFITDVAGNDLFEDQHIALFVMNDLLSNDSVKIPVHLDNSIFCNTFSIDDINVEKTILFPNPTTSIIYTNQNTKILEYAIYNTIGEIVAVKKGDAIEQINLENLPFGIYFIQMNTIANSEIKTYTQKIVKQ